MKSHAIRRPGILPLLALTVCPCFAGTCEDLAKLQLPETAITDAVTVPPSATGPLKSPVEFCRVTMSVKPSGDSDIRVEVWLPVSNWNGKFQGIGNGGFAGSIDLGALSIAVSHGYVAAATDAGHRGDVTNAAWALNHPGKIADFGYRAIHETAVRAKAMTIAFYGASPRHSYFNACSNGGRQGL